MENQEINLYRNQQRKLPPAKNKQANKTRHETEENFVCPPNKIKYTEVSIWGHKNGHELELQKIKTEVDENQGGKKSQLSLKYSEQKVCKRK